MLFLALPPFHYEVLCKHFLPRFLEGPQNAQKCNEQPENIAKFFLVSNVTSYIKIYKFVKIN
jgi:hypothetical protein